MRYLGRVLFCVGGGQQHRSQELRFRHVKFEEPLRHPSGDGGDDDISYSCFLYYFLVLCD